jgi:foldase protein PrsA
LKKLTRSVPALGAVFFALVGLAACGSSSGSGSSGVSGDDVVNVGGQPISTPTFNHWMTVAAAASNTSASQPVIVPVPPDYKACIAHLRATTPKPAKGQAPPTDAALKSQCATQYANLRSQVLEFLISADWLIGESNSQKINVKDAAVVKQFDTIKKQQFPTAAQYNQFLAESHQTEADLLLRVKLELLQTKLRNQVIKAAGSITPAKIAAYYNAHKSNYAQPEKRDLSIILTKTAAQAQAAKQAIQGGTPFATEAKKVSIDPATKAQGGAETGVEKGQEEQALDSAVFSAAVNNLSGPVKTPFGYYIFQVHKSTPASQQSLAQATAAIKSTLTTTAQQAALTKFVNGFQKRWTKMTDCAKGYVIMDCKEYKAPKAGTVTTAPATVSGEQTQSAQTVSIQSTASSSG